MTTTTTSTTTFQFVPFETNDIVRETASIHAQLVWRLHGMARQRTRIARSSAGHHPVFGRPVVAGIPSLRSLGHALLTYSTSSSTREGRRSASSSREPCIFHVLRPKNARGSRDPSRFNTSPVACMAHAWRKTFGCTQQKRRRVTNARCWMGCLIKSPSVHKRLSKLRTIATGKLGLASAQILLAKRTRSSHETDINASHAIINNTYDRQRAKEAPHRMAVLWALKPPISGSKRPPAEKYTRKPQKSHVCKTHETIMADRWTLDAELQALWCPILFCDTIMNCLGPSTSHACAHSSTRHIRLSALYCCIS